MGVKGLSGTQRRGLPSVEGVVGVLCTNQVSPRMSLTRSLPEVSVTVYPGTERWVRNETRGKSRIVCSGGL